MIEKRSDFRLAQRSGMALAAEVNEALDPVHIRFFSAAAEIAPPYSLVYLGQEARWL
jgi:hypothetical protein